MKYKITIEKVEDGCYWEATVDGKHKKLELEDLVTMLNMVNSTKGSIMKEIKDLIPDW